MSAPMQADVSFRRDERGRALELPPAMRKNVWKKGDTPNPGGRGGLYQECMKLCRKRSPDAAQRMIQLAGLDIVDEHGNLAELPASHDPRVAAMAAQWIFERAWGKVKDYDPKADQDQNRPRFDPNALSPDQLALVEHALRLMMQATRAPVSAEAEVTEVEAEEIVETENEDAELRDSGS